MGAARSRTSEKEAFTDIDKNSRKKSTYFYLKTLFWGVRGLCKPNTIQETIKDL